MVSYEIVPSAAEGATFLSLYSQAAEKKERTKNNTNVCIVYAAVRQLRMHMFCLKIDMSSQNLCGSAFCSFGFSLSCVNVDIRPQLKLWHSLCMVCGCIFIQLFVGLCFILGYHLQSEIIVSFIVFPSCTLGLSPHSAQCAVVAFTDTERPLLRTKHSRPFHFLFLLLVLW